MRLIMLVPSRGRPENARRLIAAVEATCVLPDTLIQFGVDSDDPTWHDYITTGAASDRAVITMCAPSARRGMVDALNQMWSSRPNAADAFGFMGDDHLPRTVGWDKALCDALTYRPHDPKPAALAYGNDLLQGERIPTAVAMTATVPRTLGYMAPPQLAHLYVDNVWRDWGEGLGALTYLPNVVIEHLHPAAGKAERDAGYEAVNAIEMDSADKAAYLAYRESRLAEDIAALRALT